mmetsp:Transcript_13813/g.19354  ORF Transcript_13813/g.19354 Transcript_13813/m.19354 type:complete len:453 (-) Transcript_13813:151-1509(-)
MDGEFKDENGQPWLASLFKVSPETQGVYGVRVPTLKLPAGKIKADDGLLAMKKDDRDKDPIINSPLFRKKTETHHYGKKVSFRLDNEVGINGQNPGILSKIERRRTAGRKRARVTDVSSISVGTPSIIAADLSSHKSGNDDIEDTLDDDVLALLELREIDLKLESQQTCHRCGKAKKGKDKISCKSKFCSLNGKRFCICEGCVIRLRKAMSENDFELMMRNVADPNWHCPRCVEPHFMSGTGICCCSFNRRGIDCPWHVSEPTMCCTSARIARKAKLRKKSTPKKAKEHVSSRKSGKVQASGDNQSVAEKFRKKAPSSSADARAELCKTLKIKFKTSKILAINPREICYKGFPCDRCKARGIGQQTKRQRSLKKSIRLEKVTDLSSSFVTNADTAEDDNSSRSSIFDVSRFGNLQSNFRAGNYSPPPYKGFLPPSPVLGSPSGEDLWSFDRH